MTGTLYYRRRGEKWGNRRTVDGRNDVTVVGEIVISVSLGFVIYDRYRGISGELEPRATAAGTLP